MQIGDELHTDVHGIAAKIEKYGANNIAAVITTTSCFAPRVPDRFEILINHGGDNINCGSFFLVSKKLH